MARNERRESRAIADEVRAWTRQARSVLDRRAKIDAAADRAIAQLRRGVVEVDRDGMVAWRVLPLRPKDSRFLASIARQAQLPRFTEEESATLTRLTTEVATAARDVRAVVGVRRFVSGAAKKEAGRLAADFLAQFRSWGVASGVPEWLSRVAEPEDSDIGEVRVADALSDWVGLWPRVADLGASPEVIAVAESAELAELPGAIQTLDHAARDEARFRAAAVAAGNEVRSSEARKLVAEMPVEKLKEATRERLRIGPLTDAGITTVLEVLQRGDRLQDLPGIGATTATRLHGAAETLRQTTYDEMPARIDIKNPTAQTTKLLRRLAAWDAARKAQGASADLARAQELKPVVEAVGRAVSHVVVFEMPGRSVAEFRETVDAVVKRARPLSGGSGAAGSGDPWEDFRSRPAEYFAMLSELGFLTEDEKKTHGDLPEEIVEAVRSLTLDTQHLKVSLRGYQSFGARFALVQGKVIIGDEMGLGKTIEALAVLAHLQAKGGRHSVVICPASVVTNWVREVAAKSSLRAYRVHGPERKSAARDWKRNGGVAVTTFETLAWFEDQITAVRDLACVVVDEAHYIKNPAARRTERATRVLDSCERAVLLTGTPLENRTEEFRNLVDYLRPDLVVDAGDLTPRRFRQQVAPAYLRRNQEDVLTELPELVEVEEWVPMSGDDAAAYRQAVEDGNFMAMRQAAMSQGAKSEKMQRLIDIVGEAEENEWRVVVFSYFRSVLEDVARSLPGEVFGPLTGSVSAAKRQAMVDQFSQAGHGAVLVAQIQAGGVGLNIQAASVVVICEPQLKPTTEWQAIARAHRMGQLESVQAHRLLSDEGVDQRIIEILRHKRELFEDFARISEAAGSAPEAYDISEADLARDVVAAERERLFSPGQEDS